MRRVIEFLIALAFIVSVLAFVPGGWLLWCVLALWALGEAVGWLWRQIRGIQVRPHA